MEKNTSRLFDSGRKHSPDLTNLSAGSITQSSSVLSNIFSTLLFQRIDTILEVQFFDARKDANNFKLDIRWKLVEAKSW